MASKKTQLTGGAVAALAAVIAASAPSSAVQLEVDQFGRAVVIEAPRDLLAAVVHHGMRFRKNFQEEGWTVNFNCGCEQS